MKWRVFLLAVWMEWGSRREGTLGGVECALRWRAKGSLGAVEADGRKRF